MKVVATFTVWATFAFSSALSAQSDAEAISNLNSSASDALQRLTRLLEKAEPIHDVSATVVTTITLSRAIEHAKQIPSTKERYYYSKILGLTRIEKEIPGFGTVIYFIDSISGLVYVQHGERVAALAPESAKGWLLTADIHSGKKDIGDHLLRWQRSNRPANH